MTARIMTLTGLASTNRSNGPLSNILVTSSEIRAGHNRKQPAIFFCRPHLLIDQFLAAIFTPSKGWAKGLNQYVTGLLLVLNPCDSSFDIAIAGHHRPLIRRADGQVTELEGEVGLLLAVDKEANFESNHYILKPGETMLLYTDGLIEPENSDGQAFGVERLIATLEDCGGSASETIRRINHALAGYLGAEAQPDDKTLIAITSW